jgi:hypothetical protein
VLVWGQVLVVWKLHSGTLGKEEREELGWGQEFQDGQEGDPELSGLEQVPVQVQVQEQEQEQLQGEEQEQEVWLPRVIEEEATPSRNSPGRLLQPQSSRTCRTTTHLTPYLSR